jgi:hypothetical protein
MACCIESDPLKMLPEDFVDNVCGVIKIFPSNRVAARKFRSRITHRTVGTTNRHNQKALTKTRIHSKLDLFRL